MSFISLPPSNMKRFAIVMQRERIYFSHFLEIRELSQQQSRAQTEEARQEAKCGVFSLSYVYSYVYCKPSSSHPSPWCDDLLGDGLGPLQNTDGFNLYTVIVSY